MRTGIRSALSEAEQLAASRALAQQILDGKCLIPTKTCRKCQQPALVKDGTLQSGMKGCSGTAVVPEITICLNKSCGHVSVRRFAELGDLAWQYGTVAVEMVDGSSYVRRSLPQQVTEQQRVRLREFLIQTAPR